MKNYEITFITKEEPKDSAKKILESFGGKILKTSSMGQKTFVYPIEKEKSGFYTTYLFSMEAEKVQDFNRKLTLDEEILRHLIVVIKPSQEMDGLMKKIDDKATKKEVESDIIAEEIIEEPIMAIEVEPEMAIEIKPEEEIVVVESVKEAAPKKVKTAKVEKVESKKEEKVEKVEKVEEKPKAKKVEPAEKPVKPAKPLRPEVEPVDEDERLEALDKKLEELLKD